MLARLRPGFDHRSSGSPRRFLRELVCHFLSKVHCFPDHRTGVIKNVRKRERRETTAGRRQEKHFEAERNFGAGVIDVFGRRVQARGQSGRKVGRSRGNPESSLKGQMRNTFRSSSSSPKDSLAGKA